MPIIKLDEFCCQSGGKTLDTGRCVPEDLKIAVRGNRELRFSPLGNKPKAPRVALVGITPGAQSEAFARYLRHSSVLDAAKRAAFEGAQNQIKDLLRSQDFASAIGLDLSVDLNDNPEIFTTSLVKCCLMVNGSYKYKAPDIAASPEATFCVINRFLTDIRQFPTLEWIIIFGASGWEAVKTLNINGQSVLNILRETGAEVLNFPHFAQNYQQQAIFCLDEQDEPAYLTNNPKHRPYAPKARVMRTSLRNSIKRQRSAL